MRIPATRPRRHLLSVSEYRDEMRNRFGGKLASRTFTDKIVLIGTTAVGELGSELGSSQRVNSPPTRKVDNATIEAEIGLGLSVALGAELQGIFPRILAEKEPALAI